MGVVIHVRTAEKTHHKRDNCINSDDYDLQGAASYVIHNQGYFDEDNRRFYPVSSIDYIEEV